MAVFHCPVVLLKRELTPIAVFDDIFPRPRPTVSPLTRISLHEKLAIILLVVAPE